jgi:lysophospholipase L1-like esterase
MKLPKLLLASLLGITSIFAQATGQRPNTAIVPAPQNLWMRTHEALNKIADAGKGDLMFLGDSITAGWKSQAALYNAEFGKYAPVNFGIGGDCTENILYRLQNGNLSKIRPKVIVLLIGTNNLNLNSNTPQETFEGIQAVIKEIHQRSPDSKILLLGILPREEKPGGRLRTAVEETNKLLPSLDDGKTVYYLDIGPRFLAPDGSISREVMSDFVHPAPKGYQIWAEAMREPLNALFSGKPLPSAAK